MSQAVVPQIRKVQDKKMNLRTVCVCARVCAYMLVCVRVRVCVCVCVRVCVSALILVVLIDYLCREAAAIITLSDRVNTAPAHTTHTHTHTVHLH